MSQSDYKPNITYSNRGVGTVYHPSEKISYETADKFSQVAKKILGTYYHKMDPVYDFIYPNGDKYSSLNASMEMMAAAKKMEETGCPTLSYNNGLYCFVGYETQSKTDRVINLEPAVYLFTDKELAEALKKELGEMDGSGYVPCSNGETNSYGKTWTAWINEVTETRKHSFMTRMRGGYGK